MVVDARERDAFRARAAAEGLTLSEWLRMAARERLEKGRPATIRSMDDLDHFFAERREAEAGREPDWDQHQRVMEHSRLKGLEPG